MQRRNKFLLGGLGFLGVSALVSGTLVASAYRGDPTKTGPNYSPERHAQIEKAFESNDYATWKNLMNGKGRILNVVNEGNFARFSQIHKLMEEGKTDEANKIRAELGLGTSAGKGVGRGVGNQNGQGRGGVNCPYNQTK